MKRKKRKGKEGFSVEDRKKVKRKRSEENILINFHNQYRSNPKQQVTANLYVQNIEITDNQYVKTRKITAKHYAQNSKQ